MRVETTVVVTNTLGSFARGIVPALGQVVAKTGFDAVAIEQQLSRVDTGAMKNGWTFEMTGPTEGVNYNPVAHTPANEYGTVKMSPQPMMHPAIDQVLPGLIAGAAEVMNGG